VAHFIGAVKPWTLSYNRATRSVETKAEEHPHVVDFVHTWWQIFMEDVHYRLFDDLASTLFRDHHFYARQHAMLRAS